MYISQCIIAKNEEKNIEYCLRHLKTVVDEQIVVDTGSTDKTVEIAKELGAKVFYFDWIDDFSAARNFALDKAKGDWIIFLDCDEYFSESSLHFIKDCIKKTSKIDDVDGIISELININNDKSVISIIKNVSPRIFKNSKSIRYKNKIHEILFNKKRGNTNLLNVDFSSHIKIFHTGYDKDEIKYKKKNHRNITILEQELIKNPENLDVLLYLCKQYFMNKEYKKSLEYGNEALKHLNNTDNEYYNCQIYVMIMNNMIILSSPLNLIKEIFDEATTKCPWYPDFYRLSAIAYLNSKNIDKAINYLEKCIYYCNIYSSKIESISCGQINDIYRDLLNLYVKINNKQKIVEISVLLLRVNKYDLEIIQVLIKIFLTQENEEHIIQFLSKLYDFNLFKDKIYLLKASEVNGNVKMSEFFKRLLNENEINLLNSYKL